MSDLSVAVCPPTAVPLASPSRSSFARENEISSAPPAGLNLFLAIPARTPTPGRRYDSSGSSSISALTDDLSRTSISRPPKPTIRHRVYNIRCAACDTFLSDRGMRAVLLLQPNVILFSTDAQPVNCGPLEETPKGKQAAERTCECLTSTFACFHCGTTVGYHVLDPCEPCDSSVRIHQSVAHQHRYVFHQKAVTSSERTYYPGERGVKCHTCATKVAPTIASSLSASRRKAPVVPADLFQFQPEGLTGPSASHSTPTFTPTPTAPSRSMSSPPSTTEGSQPAPPMAERRRTSLDEPERPTCFCLKANDRLYWHNLYTTGTAPDAVDPVERGEWVAERAGR